MINFRDTRYEKITKLEKQIEEYGIKIRNLNTQLENVNYTLISKNSFEKDFIVSLRKYVSPPSTFGKSPDKGDHSNIFLPRKQDQISFKEGRVPVIVGSEIFNEFVKDYQSFLSCPMKDWTKDKEDLFISFVNEMKTYFFSESDRTEAFTKHWNYLFEDTPVMMNSKSEGE